MLNKMLFSWKPSKEIKIRLIGIPLLGLFIILAFGEKWADDIPSFTLHFGLTTLICFVVWSGNVEILRYLHQRFPHPPQTFKRTLFLLMGCSSYTSIAYLVVEFCIIFGYGIPLKVDQILFGLQITFSVTVPITLLYESYFFYHNWEKVYLDAERLKKENIQAQLESLRSQVNPHFLFNSLNTLVSIIPDCPATAMDFVHKMSYVYRYLLSVKERELVTLNTELDFIEAYLFLLKVRFGESFQVDIFILEEDRDKKLPPVSLQLLIENAIKHNVISASKPLLIKIHSQEDVLLVENNKQPKQSVEESTGIGLENIQKRYKILSDKVVEIINTEHRFTVLLPLLSTLGKE